jgi:hypothetical protein
LMSRISAMAELVSLNCKIQCQARNFCPGSKRIISPDCGKSFEL